MEFKPTRLSQATQGGAAIAGRVAALLLALAVVTRTAFPAGPALPRIPPPANEWASAYLYVLDKDTNGVFMNANNRFVESLQPQFPEIKTVTNLIGKNDLSFYSTALATKFRADDAQVIASGKTFTTVEINEPTGGSRSVVRVTKIPLRDEQDRIIGLRAVWHSHPQLEARKGAGGLQVIFPKDASQFRVEHLAAFTNPSNWEPVDGTTAFPVGTNLSITLPMTNSQTYFRMNATQPVKIGALLSLTGEWASLGRNCQALIQLGLEQLNLQQLSSGSTLHFSEDIRDTKLNPELALAELQSLAKAGVKIVIGPQSSSEARLLKPWADANDVLLVSPGSTASSLSIANDNLFRFCPDDTYEAEAVVALLHADGITSLVPIWREDAGNQGLHDSVAKLFAAQNGTVSAGASYSATETNFNDVVATISAQVALASKGGVGRVGVYLAGFDEVADIFQKARLDSGLSAVPWYGSDGVVQSEALAKNDTSAQFALERGYPCPTFGLDSRYASIFQPLATLVKIRTGNDVDAFALAGYDALQVAVTAYRAVGFNPGFGNLRTAFVAAAGNYDGATGKTLLNAAGDRAGGAFDFWSLRNAPPGHAWRLTMSFQPQENGPGVILRYP